MLEMMLLSAGSSLLGGILSSRSQAKAAESAANIQSETTLLATEAQIAAAREMYQAQIWSNEAMALESLAAQKESELRQLEAINASVEAQREAAREAAQAQIAAAERAAAAQEAAARAAAAAQTESAQIAAGAQVRSAEMAIAEQRRQVDEAVRLLEPFRQAGVDALPGFAPFQEAGLRAFEQQQALSGLLGTEAQREAVSALEASPEMQAIARQGEEALLQRASATGGLRGGDIQAALAQFRPQMLQQQIERQLGRLGGFAATGLGVTSELAGMGQASAARQAATGMGGGQAIAGLLSQVGAAQAAAAQQSGMAQAAMAERLGMSQAELAARMGAAQAGGAQALGLAESIRQQQLGNLLGGSAQQIGAIQAARAGGAGTAASNLAQAIGGATTAGLSAMGQIGAGRALAQPPSVLGQFLSSMPAMLSTYYGATGQQPTFSGLQASFAGTRIGSGGFGTGFAYGNQDIGQFIG